MPLTRRNFLIRGSLSLAAGALSSVLVEAKTKESAPADFKDWESVRRQFELAPGYIHLALFFLASHPRPVRQAIEQYRAKLDANPLLTVEGAIFEQTERISRCRFAALSPTTLAATVRTSHRRKTRRRVWLFSIMGCRCAKATRS